MKKISFFVVALLLISGIATIGISKEADVQQISIEKQFFEPSIVDEENYVQLEIKGTNSYLLNEGEPILPIYKETLTLPFGVTITNVECTVTGVENEILSKKIIPGPQQIIENDYAVSTISTIKEEIYSSDELFPNDWFSYDVGVGIDENYNHVTYVTTVCYPVRYSPNTNTITHAKNIDLTVKYEESNQNPFPALDEYDMVIIAPIRFNLELQKLVDHKNNLNPPVKTIIKNTNQIYRQYTGYDKPEKIKNFIKEAIESWGIKYVLIVGGLNSPIWAIPRDNANEGTKDWLVPVRYTNLAVYGDEPGFLSDLYYSDIYTSGGAFENWDKNGNHIYAEAGDHPDLYPDVAVGRLACRNVFEVNSVVDKIIHYENTYDPTWFNNMLCISGDGFLDQEDLDIQWDTNGLANGQYTIYAQSTNPYADVGPLETINVTLDKSSPTSIHFNHDDYLRIPNFPDSYPFLPMAEIVSVSEGDVLGYNNTFYKPPENKAYCNDNTGWANVQYTNQVLYIRGKTYDPQPYGNETTINVWIENSVGTTVFTAQKISNTFFEGEWSTGEVLLKGRAGGAYYMPSDFNIDLLWGSNGAIVTGPEDVKAKFDLGSGFAFFSGHGSPNVWANHFPGIPGNRRIADFVGLRNIEVKGPVYFPMQHLQNNYKNPVVVVGGCHNSMFNVTFITTLLDETNAKFTHCYGIPTAECWSWSLVRLAKRGSIATIGNTGYGYGNLGEYCTIGGADNWITTEFFVKYGSGVSDKLGTIHALAIESYINEFGKTDGVDVKTVEQWVLLGDPSLKMGGYENAQQEVEIQIEDNGLDLDGMPDAPVGMQALNNNQGTPISYEWSFDTTGDGVYDTVVAGENVEQTWDKPGVYWVQLKAIYNDHEETTETVVNIESTEFPDAPAKPSGRTNVNINIPFIYETSSTDPQDVDLWYLFDWGDGTYGVAGALASGNTAKAIHTWKEKGTYEIKVMAINDFGYWSDWSEPITVTVTKAKSRDIANEPILYLFQKFFNNHPNFLPILKQLLGL